MKHTLTDRSKNLQLPQLTPLGMPQPNPAVPGVTHLEGSYPEQFPMIKWFKTTEVKQLSVLEEAPSQAGVSCAGFSLTSTQGWILGCLSGAVAGSYCCLGSTPCPCQAASNYKSLIPIITGIRICFEQHHILFFHVAHALTVQCTNQNDYFFFFRSETKVLTGWLSLFASVCLKETHTGILAGNQHG